jgi:hypothetical protein
VEIKIATTTITLETITTTIPNRLGTIISLHRNSKTTEMHIF